MRELSEVHSKPIEKLGNECLLWPSDSHSGPVLLHSSSGPVRTAHARQAYLDRPHISQHYRQDDSHEAQGTERLQLREHLLYRHLVRPRAFLWSRP